MLLQTPLAAYISHKRQAVSSRTFFNKQTTVIMSKSPSHHVRHVHNKQIRIPTIPTTSRIPTKNSTPEEHTGHKSSKQTSCWCAFSLQTLIAMTSLLMQELWMQHAAVRAVQAQFQQRCINFISQSQLLLLMQESGMQQAAERAAQAQPQQAQHKQNLIMLIFSAVSESSTCFCSCRNHSCNRLQCVLCKHNPNKHTPNKHTPNKHSTEKSL